MGPQLHGRAAEHATVRALLADVRTGVGRFALVTGPAGIGKSTLADAVATEAAAAGVTGVRGDGWEAGGAPAYRPWTQVLGELVRLRGPGVAPTAGRLGALLPELGPAGPPPTSDGARFALLDAVGAVLRSAAADAPLLVVLDDLHIAGRPSALMLQFLAAELRRAPVLLLATARPVAAGTTSRTSSPRWRRRRRSCRCAASTARRPTCWSPRPSARRPTPGSARRCSTGPRATRCSCAR